MYFQITIYFSYRISNKSVIQCSHSLRNMFAVFVPQCNIAMDCYGVMHIYYVFIVCIICISAFNKLLILIDLRSLYPHLT